MYQSQQPSTAVLSDIALDSDTLDAVSLGRLLAATEQRLRQLYPDAEQVDNPVIVAAGPDLAEAVDVLMADPEVDQVLIIGLNADKVADDLHILSTWHEIPFRVRQRIAVCRRHVA